MIVGTWTLREKVSSGELFLSSEFMTDWFLPGEGAFINEHKRLHLDILDQINQDHALMLRRYGIPRIRFTETTRAVDLALI
jgi:hypothetical protein